MGNIIFKIAITVIISYGCGAIVALFALGREIREVRKKNEQLKEVIKFYRDKQQGDNNEHTD